MLGGKSRVLQFFIDYLGHDVHACPQITKAMLIIFVVDRAANHGTPGSSCTAATRPSQESFFGDCTYLAWLVRGGLRDGLPHLVDTMLTFSMGVSGCPGIFPLSIAGKEAAI